MKLMKGWIWAIWLMSLAMTTLGQDKAVFNDPNAVVREVDDFDAIVISGAIELIFMQGPEHKVAIGAGDPDDVEKISTETRNGKLYIKYRNGDNWWQNQWNTMGRKFKAYVSAPRMREISTSGSGSIRILGLLKAEGFKLDVSGSGNVIGEIEADEFEMDQSGSSNIRLSGKVGRASVQCSGSGNIQSSDLLIDYLDIDISGSGNAELWVNRELSAQISGSGNIRYKGDGSIKNMSVSGSGKIRKI
jgi:hypothetical protein